MNYILAEHIVYLSEKKSRFSKVKSWSSRWQNMIKIALVFITIKVAIEQVIMLVKNA